MSKTPTSGELQAAIEELKTARIASDAKVEAMDSQGCAEGDPEYDLISPGHVWYFETIGSVRNPIFLAREE